MLCCRPRVTENPSGNKGIRLYISMMKLYKWFLLSITKGSSVWNVIKVKEMASSYSSPLSTNINMKGQQISFLLALINKWKVLDKRKQIMIKKIKRVPSNIIACYGHNRPANEQLKVHPWMRIKLLQHSRKSYRQKCATTKVSSAIFGKRKAKTCICFTSNWHF